MSVFFVLSLLACIIYLHVGIYAFILNYKEKLNLTFLILCSCMALWSFSYAFAYDAPYTDEYALFTKVASIGWCLSTPLFLHIVMLITKNSAEKNKLFMSLLYLPSIIFIILDFVFFWPSSVTPELIQNVFYNGYFIYNLIVVSSSIILLILWMMKKDIMQRQRKQAFVIVISGSIPFLINLVKSILNFFNVKPFNVALPDIGQIFGLILIFGIFYSMVRYGLFNYSPLLIKDEIMSEMMDLVIVLDGKGNIVKVNKRFEKLFQYNFQELLDKPIVSLFCDNNFNAIFNNNESERVKLHRFEEIHGIKKDGSLVPLSLTCYMSYDPKLRELIGAIIVGHDMTITKKLEQEITHHKKAEEYISFLANHDNLTGLPNRKYFYEELNERIAKSQENDIFAVLFMDLDNFKITNDKYGHEAGDYLLCEVGKIIKKNLRKTDLIARIGGDEFLLMINDINNIVNTNAVMFKLINALDTEKIFWNNHYLNVQASIGVSIYPMDGNTAKELVKKADENMYSFKRSRKAQISQS